MFSITKKCLSHNLKNKIKCTHLLETKQTFCKHQKIKNVLFSNNENLIKKRNPNLINVSSQLCMSYKNLNNSDKDLNKEHFSEDKIEKSNENCNSKSEIDPSKNVKEIKNCEAINKTINSKIRNFDETFKNENFVNKIKNCENEENKSIINNVDVLSNNENSVKKTDNCVQNNGNENSSEKSLNNPKNSLAIGQSFETIVRITYENLIMFGKLSRDWNPIHYKSNDPDVKKLRKMFKIESKQDVQKRFGKPKYVVNSCEESTPDHSKENTKKTSDCSPIIPGAFLNNIISGIIGTQLPGPGTLIRRQTLEFKNMCYLNEDIHFRVEVTNVRKAFVYETYSCWVSRHGKQVVIMTGDAQLFYKPDPN